MLESDLMAKKPISSDLEKRIKAASPKERKELLSLVTAEMARERWRKTSKQARSEIMRKVAAGGKDAKPKPRCPCGAMTLDRAITRKHYARVDGKMQCRPGVGL